MWWKVFVSVVDAGDGGAFMWCMVVVVLWLRWLWVVVRFACGGGWSKRPVSEQWINSHTLTIHWLFVHQEYVYTHALMLWWHVSPVLWMQEGCNAFHLCAEGRHPAVAQYLQVQLFATDGDGSTALHRAAKAGQLHTVEYLVRSCGFDVTARDEVGLHFFILITAVYTKPSHFLVVL